MNGRIDFLPPKYGMWNFVNKRALFYHNHYQDYTLRKTAYDDTEVFNAWRNPGIIHFVRTKPWKRKNVYTHLKFHNKWCFLLIGVMSLKIF